MILTKPRFIVDKVSEDSFYENLLLGLTKVLQKSQFISNIYLNRLNGVKHVDVQDWEHNNGIALPKDLVDFYASTDGFFYSYNFSYDCQGGQQDKVVYVGKIDINSLQNLTRAYGYEVKNTAQIEQVGKKMKLNLSNKSKVFELTNINECDKVVLVYLDLYNPPTVWLYTNAMSFYYIAEDFTTYFKMCIAHVGIPYWQFVVSVEGIPAWSREMFQILAPGVLLEDRDLVVLPQHGNFQMNKIDKSIFIASNTKSTCNSREQTTTSLNSFQQKGKKQNGKIKKLKDNVKSKILVSE